jgi:hypothetical protein
MPLIPRLDTSNRVSNAMRRTQQAIAQALAYRYVGYDGGAGAEDCLVLVMAPANAFPFKIGQ